MKRKFEITDASGGAAFTVRVVTRTRRNEIVGIQDDGILKVRLTASPEDDDVNAELVGILSDVLEVSRDHIEIVAGQNARDKLVSVDGITTAYLEERLTAVVGGDEDR